MQKISGLCNSSSSHPAANSNFLHTVDFSIRQRLDLNTWVLGCMSHAAHGALNDAQAFKDEWHLKRHSIAFTNKKHY